MNSLKAGILLNVLILNLACCYKILVFFPYPGKSHSILGSGFVKHLVNAGHNITYVTPVPFKNPAPNLRQIDTSSNFQIFSLEDVLNITKLIDKQIDLTDTSMLNEIMHEIAVLGVKHENVQKLLMDTSESFDAVIVEWLYTEFYSGVASVFECPYIWSSSMEPHAMVMRLIDEMPNPAYIPDHMSPLIPPLNFLERVGELMQVVDLYRVTWAKVEKENQDWIDAYTPAFAARGRQVPSFDEVRFNSSLMFGNSHLSAGLPVRLPQNYVPIGGYHIDSDTPPLPENLQKIMDSASHGVIYFSLGTMMKGSTLPDELKRGFLKTFSELKQTVIWKFEDKLSDLPKNVHIVEWAPQQSIMAHPNTVLFITHGGLLSTTEAIHFGVPIIGIPLFADQFINIKRAVAKGIGRDVAIGYDADVKLIEAIHDILENPKYRERVKELSFIYHHRPVPPGAELVHWTEHVIMTRGKQHRRSPGFLVPWYQKLYLDLLACIVISLTLIAITLKKTFSRLRVSKKLKRS